MSVRISRAFFCDPGVLLGAKVLKWNLWPNLLIWLLLCPNKEGRGYSSAIYIINRSAL